jgi:hypothetical protein
MDDLSVEDIRQLYVGSVCMHKGVPIYFYKVSMEHVVTYYVLETQALKTAKFSLKDFTSPAGRLGFVNVMGGAVYVQRLPVRRFSVGLTKENLLVKTVRGCRYPEGENASIERIKGRNTPELHYTMMGVFPSMEEAYNEAVDVRGCVAFDRQFCINCDTGVYYKTQFVGVYGDKKINFEPQHKYLELLLGNEYEKGSGTHRFAKG